jgi:hypothetical protein
VAKKNKLFGIPGRTQLKIIVLKRTQLRPTDIRIEKVLEIRRQLAEGKYDINKRLNGALDKILENLVT